MQARTGTSTILVAGLAVAAAAAAAAGSLQRSGAERIAVTEVVGAPAAEHGAFEVERIQAHLADVESELRAADVSGLTAAQRQARARHIEVLRGYREAGVFPHNHVLPGRLTPVFVDEHGTHCAVGYLLARDGRHDLVARISATRNTATVRELADEPELVAWLEESGLTLAEAARIQPWYGEPAPQVEPKAPAGAFTAASLAGMGAGGGMIAWNLLLDRDAKRTVPGALGLGVGLAQIGLATYGAAQQDDRDIDSAHIVANLGLGLVSSVLGLRTLLRDGAVQAASPAASSGGAGAQQRLQWQLSPWLPQGDGGAGMRLRLQF